MPLIGGLLFLRALLLLLQLPPITAELLVEVTVMLLVGGQLCLELPC